MRKIANTSELQTELRRLLSYAQSERPSRMRLATALLELSSRLKTAGVNWTEVPGGAWLTKVQYASGIKHSWGIEELDGEFWLEVDIPNSGDVGGNHIVYRCKKPFQSLEKAQKYAAKFIDKAHGQELLEAVLDKDFKRLSSSGVWHA